MKNSTAGQDDILRLAGTLILLVRTLDQRLRQQKENDSLQLAELGILGKIERGTSTPSLLARELRLDPARVTHLTDRLVAQGFITRELDSADRRRWRLNITANGQSALQRGRTVLRAGMESLLSELHTEQRNGFTQGLDGLYDVLHAIQSHDQETPSQL